MCSRSENTLSATQLLGTARVAHQSIAFMTNHIGLAGRTLRSSLSRFGVPVSLDCCMTLRGYRRRQVPRRSVVQPAQPTAGLLGPPWLLSVGVNQPRFSTKDFALGLQFYLKYAEHERGHAQRDSGAEHDSLPELQIVAETFRRGNAASLAVRGCEVIKVRNLTHPVRDDARLASRRAHGHGTERADALGHLGQFVPEPRDVLLLCYFPSKDLQLTGTDPDFRAVNHFWLALAVTREVRVRLIPTRRGNPLVL